MLVILPHKQASNAQRCPRPQWWNWRHHRKESHEYRSLPISERRKIEASCHSVLHWPEERNYNGCMPLVPWTIAQPWLATPWRSDWKENQESLTALTLGGISTPPKTPKITLITRPGRDGLKKFFGTCPKINSHWCNLPGKERPLPRMLRQCTCHHNGTCHMVESIGCQMKLLIISGANVEVTKWISNFVSHYIGNVITYPCRHHSNLVNIFINLTLIIHFW